MGYDITAYRPKAPPTDPRSVAVGEELGVELAYLAMGARAADAPKLFEALSATEYDGQVSGNGIGRFFTRAQVDAALKILCAQCMDDAASVRVLRFVAQVVDALAMDEWVYIEFM